MIAIELSKENQYRPTAEQLAAISNEVKTKEDYLTIEILLNAAVMKFNPFFHQNHGWIHLAEKSDDPTDVADNNSSHTGNSGGSQNNDGGDNGEDPEKNKNNPGAHSNCQQSDLCDLSKMKKAKESHLKKKGFDPHKIKKDVHANSKQDLYVNNKGDIYVGNKRGNEEGEFIGYNIHQGM